MDDFGRLERDARNLLADNGYAGVELVRVDPEWILFLKDDAPFVAWKHERVRMRKTNTGNRVESVSVWVHVEEGWPACESFFVEDAA